MLSAPEHDCYTAFGYPGHAWGGASPAKATPRVRGGPRWGAFAIDLFNPAADSLFFTDLLQSAGDAVYEGTVGGAISDIHRGAVTAKKNPNSNANLRKQYGVAGSSRPSKPPAPEGWFTRNVLRPLFWGD